MKKTIILFIFLSNLFASYAQTDDVEPRPYINKHFCIILSTKSYTEANKIAIQASKFFKIKLDYRDLLPNKKIVKVKAGNFQHTIHVEEMMMANT